MFCSPCSLGYSTCRTLQFCRVKACNATSITFHSGTCSHTNPSPRCANQPPTIWLSLSLRLVSSRIKAGTWRVAITESDRNKKYPRPAFPQSSVPLSRHPGFFPTRQLVSDWPGATMARRGRKRVWKRSYFDCVLQERWPAPAMRRGRARVALSSLPCDPASSLSPCLSPLLASSLSPLLASSPRPWDR